MLFIMFQQRSETSDNKEKGQSFIHYITVCFHKKMNPRTLRHPNKR